MTHGGRMGDGAEVPKERFQRISSENEIPSGRIMYSKDNQSQRNRFYEKLH